MKTRQWRVNDDQAGSTLQDFLSNALGVSRNRAKSLLDLRQVFINGRRVWMARHTVQRGDTIESPADASATATTETPPLSILVNDPDFVIVDKPAGLAANGTDSAETLLRVQLAAPELRAAHRLDRDTSGCLLCARHPRAFDDLVEVFRSGRVLKLYHALVVGRVRELDRTIERPVEGAPATTHMHLLDANDTASHVRLKIDTGRTHQIRIHMLGIGNPILGERNYGQRHVLPPEVRHVERQMLHAQAIQFESPRTKKTVRGESPLPADFTAWLKRLRLK